MPGPGVGMPGPGMGMPEPHIDRLGGVVPPVVSFGDAGPSHRPGPPVIPQIVDRPVIPDFGRYDGEPGPPGPHVYRPEDRYSPSGPYIPRSSSSGSPPVVVIPPPMPPHVMMGPPPTMLTHRTRSPTPSEGTTETLQTYDPHPMVPMVVQEPRRPSRPATPTHHTVVVPSSAQPPVVPMQDPRQGPRTGTPAEGHPPPPITINLPPQPIPQPIQAPAGGPPVMVGPPVPPMPSGIMRMPTMSSRRGRRDYSRSPSRSRSPDYDRPPMIISDEPRYGPPMPYGPVPYGPVPYGPSEPPVIIPSSPGRSRRDDGTVLMLPSGSRRSPSYGDRPSRRPTTYRTESRRPYSPSPPLPPVVIGDQRPPTAPAVVVTGTGRDYRPSDDYPYRRGRSRSRSRSPRHRYDSEYDHRRYRSRSPRHRYDSERDHRRYRSRSPIFGRPWFGRRSSRSRRHRRSDSPYSGDEYDRRRPRDYRRRRSYSPTPSIRSYTPHRRSSRAYSWSPTRRSHYAPIDRSHPSRYHPSRYSPEQDDRPRPTRYPPTGYSFERDDGVAPYRPTHYPPSEGDGRRRYPPTLPHEEDAGVHPSRLTRRPTYTHTPRSGSPDHTHAGRRTPQAPTIVQIGGPGSTRHTDDSEPHVVRIGSHPRKFII